MNTVYFIRHGENPANLTREFSCRLVDYSLTEKGILQATETARFFAETPVDAIYSSPLKRAAETAAIIAEPHHLPVSTLDQFREIDVGELEGQPPSDELWTYHDSILKAWLSGTSDTAFPGGESHHQLIARMRDGMEQTLRGRDEQRVVVVAHGGILLSAIQDLCPSVSLSDLETLEMGNCAITEVAFERHNGHLTGILRGWALCTHLT
ncbi:MAG TPA: histidine phosphatase family protein [Ktedonobacterales bacterium]|nr:histidine phosphatase family protein [Ktedonobacterales bacterium]